MLVFKARDGTDRVRVAFFVYGPDREFLGEHGVVLTHGEAIQLADFLRDHVAVNTELDASTDDKSDRPGRQFG